MISICLTCANCKAGKCAAGIGGDIIPDFICDFYQQKRSGAFIISERGGGKRYVMEKMMQEVTHEQTNGIYRSNSLRG